ncbi:catalase [Kitasatospora sp. NPDC127067]|uniref:catalase n=1 Tax=Kitasatospora sp. NPDC127067 TaxID=3347126 RepID=UPI003664B5A1
MAVDDTDNSLTVGDRGPTLLEDFHLREKLTRFDHERIPERVVHARGAGAYCSASTRRSGTRPSSRRAAIRTSTAATCGRRSRTATSPSTSSASN